MILSMYIVIVIFNHFKKKRFYALFVFCVLLHIYDQCRVKPWGADKGLSSADGLQRLMKLIYCVKLLPFVNAEWK